MNQHCKRFFFEFFSECTLYGTERSVHVLFLCLSLRISVCMVSCMYMWCIARTHARTRTRTHRIPRPALGIRTSAFSLLIF